MKITIIQSRVLNHKEENLNGLKELLNTPLQTDLIVLPEMFVSPFDNEFFYQNAVEDGDDFFDVLKEIAIKHNAYIVAGSVPEKDKEKYYNTSYVFDPLGNVITKYRKIHLFEVTYPNAKTYRESDIIQAGNVVIHFTINDISIGLMICFDVRFPKLSAKLREQGCEILVVPAAFNKYTGPLHWQLAFRARAVDNQLFTIGVSPSDLSLGNYQYYGHSIVVNPLGEVIFEATGSDILVHTIELDLNEVKRVRNALPIIKNEVDL